MFAQQVCETRPQPLFISYFDRKFVCTTRKFSQERLETRNKLHVARKNITTEKWELKDHWPKLFAQNFHGVHELLELVVAIQQDLFVSNGLRDFYRENKSGRSSQRPVAHGLSFWSAVKRRVNFYSVESRSVMGKIVRRFHALRIKRPRPARRCECGRSQANLARLPHLL